MKGIISLLLLALFVFLAIRELPGALADPPVSKAALKHQRSVVALWGWD